MLTVMRRVSRRKLAATGFVLLAAPSYFVAAAILKYGFGIGLFFDSLAAFFAEPQRLRFLNFLLTPILFFGGSLVALGLNLYAALSPRPENGPKRRVSNLVVITISVSLLVVMATYGYLENFTRP
jgi:hypothetical protein